MLALPSATGTRMIGRGDGPRIAFRAQSGRFFLPVKELRFYFYVFSYVTLVIGWVGCVPDRGLVSRFLGARFVS